MVIYEELMVNRKSTLFDQCFTLLKSGNSEIKKFMQGIRITIEKYKENDLDLKFCSYSNYPM